MLIKLSYICLIDEPHMKKKLIYDLKITSRIQSDHDHE